MHAHYHLTSGLLDALTLCTLCAAKPYHTAYVVTANTSFAFTIYGMKCKQIRVKVIVVLYIAVTYIFIAVTYICIAVTVLSSRYNFNYA